ncbi:MAG: helix-turn-helix transcriptional regulator [Clostridia bacterium]|nr:helix-turn-helix transcriptional regulator [Clostridia bacterium]
MIELKISEVILRERKKQNMTQEALAEALGVSPQAVSHWERGGYPDITMLPSIANLFGITVDELLGNDPLSKELEYSDFYNQLDAIENDIESVRFAIEYYRKNPKDYQVGNVLSELIMDLDKEKRRAYLPILREVCERIINECSWQWCRQNAIRRMCAVCSDDEYEKWYAMCPDDYSANRREVFEERLWVQEKWDESRLQFDINNLSILLHFLSRKHRNRAHPERACAWYMNQMRVIEFLGKDGKIPEAWLGKYSDLHFRAACSSFGMGRVEEGYRLLETAFSLYEIWTAIPTGTALEVGDISLFGGVKVLKDQFRLLLPNGEYDYHCVDGCFYDSKEFMYCVMTVDHGWEWFDSVRNDERFQDFVKRAKAYACHT